MDEVKAAAGHVAVVRELNSVADAAGAGDGAEDAAVNPLVGQLHHVETVDKSKPVIDPSTHVQKVGVSGGVVDRALLVWLCAGASAQHRGRS
jgi:hypothetical protein